MSFRTCTTNALASATASGAAAATGYSRNAWTDGHASILFRSSGSATTHDLIFDRGAIGPGLDFAAVFGVRGTTLGAGGVSSIVVASGADGITFGTIRGTITVDERGDGWCALVPASTERWLRFRVTLASADTLDVGDVWAGIKSDLARDIVGPYEWGEDTADVYNDADDRTIWTDQVADRVDDLVFAWDSLLPDELAEVQAYHRAVRGRVRSHVVVPDSAAADVFLGHLTSRRFVRRQDVPIATGVRLGFQACGHYFYG